MLMVFQLNQNLLTPVWWYLENLIHLVYCRGSGKPATMNEELRQVSRGAGKTFWQLEKSQDEEAYDLHHHLNIAFH